MADAGGGVAVGPVEVEGESLVVVVVDGGVVVRTDVEVVVDEVVAVDIRPNRRMAMEVLRERAVGVGAALFL